MLPWMVRKRPADLPIKILHGCLIMPSKKNTASLSPSSSALTIDAIRHEDATRKNIPTAELQSVMRRDEQSPIRVAYARRNRDLDPQLVWRGKDAQDEEAELRDGPSRGTLRPRRLLGWPAVRGWLARFENPLTGTGWRYLQHRLCQYFK